MVFQSFKVNSDDENLSDEERYMQIAIEQPSSKYYIIYI